MIIDNGQPIGRPSLYFEPNGRLLVVWLEQAKVGADLLFRRIEKNNRLSKPVKIATVKTGFLSGYPKLFKNAGKYFVFWPDGKSAQMVQIDPFK